MTNSRRRRQMTVHFLSVLELDTWLKICQGTSVQSGVNKRVSCVHSRKEAIRKETCCHCLWSQEGRQRQISPFWRPWRSSFPFGQDKLLPMTHMHRVWPCSLGTQRPTRDNQSAAHRSQRHWQYCRRAVRQLTRSGLSGADSLPDEFWETRGELRGARGDKVMQVRHCVPTWAAPGRGRHLRHLENLVRVSADACQVHKRCWMNISFRFFPSESFRVVVLICPIYKLELEAIGTHSHTPFTPFFLGLAPLSDGMKCLRHLKVDWIRIKAPAFLKLRFRRTLTNNNQLQVIRVELIAETVSFSHCFVVHCGCHQNNWSKIQSVQMVAFAFPWLLSWCGDDFQCSRKPSTLLIFLPPVSYDSTVSSQTAMFSIIWSCVMNVGS